MARHLWNEDLPIPFPTQCFLTCKEGVCLIKLEPVQKQKSLLLVLISKTYNTLAAHAW